MGTPPGWGLEHRASNPVSVKNLTAIETSIIVKLLRSCVPVGTKRTITDYYLQYVIQKMLVTYFSCYYSNNRKTKKTQSHYVLNHLLSPTMQKIEAGIAQRYSTGLWAE
jgi:hypothetical protein